MSSYNTLSQYNSFDSVNGRGIHPPVPVGTPTMAIQVVPVYGMPGYEALTHGGVTNGEGHFTILGAYPSYPGSCDKFSQRLCTGSFSGRR